jgi:hemerythrin-like domain-containing protein
MMQAWCPIFCAQAVSSHAAKEEMVLYPVVRAALGPAVADQLTSEHSMVKQLLTTLDTMAATDPGFDMQLRASLDNIIVHMQVW